MVSESELIARIREFLRGSDLNTTTTSTVRRQLESDFGIDLSDRKAFIREQVDWFLQSVNQLQEDEPENDDVVEDADKPEPSQGSASKEETEEAEEVEEEAKEKPMRTRSAKKEKKKKNQKSKKRSNKSGDEVVKKKGGGFSKICSLSPQLQECLGAPEMSRGEVVKQLWAYIREKNLQDPDNRRKINCDEPLRALFGVNSINMFQMNKVLPKHIWPLDSDDVIQVKSAPKEKQKRKREDDDEPKGKEKQQKGGSGKGFLAPLQLSDALAKLLGESELSRSEVTKRMWDYIKGNNLQDPSDKRQVICDEKLKELLGVDSFNGFSVAKLLVPHFIKS